MTTIRIVTWVVLVGVFIFGIWLGAWYVGVETTALKQATSQPLADIFSSINALFAGCAFGGVIITVYLQIRELHETRSELKKTAEANSQMAMANALMAAHANERSVLDLFQTYCSEYFQKVKNASMSVLIPCVASKTYCDFVVSRLFVAGQLPFPSECQGKLEQANATYGKSFAEFRNSEQENRYKLDELLNFFTLLTGQSNSREVIRRCDFSYSWWRPLFWLIASQQRKRFESNELVRIYATPLYLLDVVRSLDEIYGFTPFVSDAEMWDFIVNHPKLAAYGLDDEYKVLANDVFRAWKSPCAS